MLVVLGLFPLAVMLLLLFAAVWIREGERPEPTARELPPARPAEPR
jgi:hypothetical protein